MNSIEHITLLSTGGTFNKYYDPVAGELKVDPQAQAVKQITDAWYCHLKLVPIIGKDSLEMEEKDREQIARSIEEERNRKILVVHGTDTMDRSAAYLAERFNDRQIVLTGAMIPYSIDPVEATANLGSALGWMLGNDTPGVYIAMHGLILPYDRIVKDRQRGVFVRR
ncbi:asparaginase domain-containing protein [Nitratifractor sp.]|uniref:asparaginase domain-containing protein n=1 Tax=Nitratifractor sp. TaxID=2268144 RepID=UPI0025E0624E|nr:asparaginase domain-containing protein [Nitratifractor sp.]